MTITAKHNRIVVGLRLEEWTVVYYEPIDSPEDLTIPHCAPVVGLYSRSKGNPREDDPMFGEVAWEPLLSHDYVKSGAKAERLQLQRKLLYDAWRYLVAKEPRDIVIIKEQLQGSRKGTVLLEQLDQARKTRSSSIEQTRKRREKRRQMKLERGLPAESVEKYDDEEDSGIGSDVDAGGEDNREGRMPPPPPPPRFRVPNSRHGGLRTSQPPRSRAREASSAVEDDEEVVEVVQPGGNAATSRGRGSAPPYTSSSKRPRNESPGTQSPRGRTGGIDRSKRLFGKTLMTPASSQSQRPRDNGHNARHESPSTRKGHGDFHDDDEAMAAGMRQSLDPSEQVIVGDLNNGPDDDDDDDDESFGR
jgi:hypothetical protein